MARIRLYDLLPLVIKIRDQEASPEEETILQKVLSATEGQREEFEQLIEGLRRLIDVDSCPTTYLWLIASLVGGYKEPVTLYEWLQRFWIHQSTARHKIAGTVFMWHKAMRYRDFTSYPESIVKELYKTTPYEKGNYSLLRTETHPYRAARVVVFEAPLYYE